MNTIKPYRGKTLAGARRRIRELQRNIEQYRHVCEELKLDRKLLAQLAADGPAFDNPLIVVEAKRIRNAVLRHECNLAPDGKPLTRSD